MDKITTRKTETTLNKICPECGSKSLIIDRKVGEEICNKCGYVINDIFLDRSPEWRAFNSQEREKRSRMGLPISLAISDKGLHTTISGTGIKGKVSKERKLQLFRLSRWQRRVSGSANQRNLNKAMSIQARLVSQLNIRRNVQEQAALFYRKALNKELVKGRSIEDVISACLYTACRMTNTQRTLGEISKHVSSNKLELARAYRLLYKELDLKIQRPNAKNRIPKIASRARIPQKIQQRAIELLRTAEKEKITAGKDPNGLAAAALYIACIQEDQKFTQKEIAYAADVTEVTIRNRYKGIVKALSISL